MPAMLQHLLEVIVNPPWPVICWWVLSRTSRCIKRTFGNDSEGFCSITSRAPVLKRKEKKDFENAPREKQLCRFLLLPYLFLAQNKWPKEATTGIFCHQKQILLKFSKNQCLQRLKPNCPCVFHYMIVFHNLTHVNWLHRYMIGQGEP